MSLKVVVAEDNGRFWVIAARPDEKKRDARQIVD